MKNIRWKYWVAGTLTAFSGVGLVKWSILSDHRLLELLGYSLALLGLFVITLGTRRTE
jgi:drug/metabolite transporter (DMT)-like permease